ncbi:MAG: ABC transporter ATP-binding protein [Phycisphaerae bacterium]|nr:ABC transporter ATP-binding protein [Phycisphaerae bacterium]
MCVIRARQLRKQYRMGESVVNALDGVDLEIHAGEFVSIVGASGSGKSTLMHIFGCLDRPTAGVLEFRGERIDAMNERQLARIRNRHIGFVFQTFNLINRTSALDNVVVPLVYTRRSFSRKAAMAALERVGLARRSRHRPSEMSGGECQRVAIARAIVNNPELILADEPTGNLDTRTGEQIMDIFHGLHAAGITIVLVTHEMDIAAQAQRMIRMRDGNIIEDVAITEAQRRMLITNEQEFQMRDRALPEPAAPRGHRSPLAAGEG